MRWRIEPTQCFLLLALWRRKNTKQNTKTAFIIIFIFDSPGISVPLEPWLRQHSEAFPLGKRNEVVNLTEKDEEKEKKERTNSKSR